jgi:glutathione S-transferase
MGISPDEAVVIDAMKAVEEYFEVAERLLAKQEYMVGKDFSLVDIFYIPLVQRLFVCGYGDVVRSRRVVSAWWDRCISRPGFRP